MRYHVRAVAAPYTSRDQPDFWACRADFPRRLGRAPCIAVRLKAAKPSSPTFSSEVSCELFSRGYSPSIPAKGGHPVLAGVADPENRKCYR